MKKELKNSLELLKKHLENMSPQEIENAKEFFRDKTPKGWVNIEEHLPGWRVKDLEQGYSEYKVRNSKGEESVSRVTDHNTWYHTVKEEGITEWFNE